jgi:hypothetical protein
MESWFNMSLNGIIFTKPPKSEIYFQVKLERCLVTYFISNIHGKKLSLVVSTSRQIEIEIEIVLSVETNF